MELGFTWKEIIVVVFIAGGIWAQLQAIRKDIKRLEKKVDEHNHFDRRIVALETAVEIYHAQERARELQK